MWAEWEYFFAISPRRVAARSRSANCSVRSAAPPSCRPMRHVKIEGTREATWNCCQRWFHGKRRNWSKTYIRIYVKWWVLNEGLGHVHDLRQDKDILQTMGDLLSNELNEVWHQLMKTRVLAKTRISRCSEFLTILVQDRAAHLLEVELQFFGQHMLHQWLDSHIPRATHSSKCRISVRSLRCQLEVAGVGCCRILRYRWLHTFHREPVAYKASVSFHEVFFKKKQVTTNQ